MPIIINDIVARVSVDASRFNAQLASMQSQAGTAIGNAQAASQKLMAMQLQAQQYASSSATMTAKILTDAMHMMTAQAHHLRAAMLDVKGAAQHTMNKIQHERYKIQSEMARINLEKAQIDQRFMGKTWVDDIRDSSLKTQAAQMNARLARVAAQQAAIDANVLRQERAANVNLGTARNPQIMSVGDAERLIRTDQANVSKAIATNNRALHQSLYPSGATSIGRTQEHRQELEAKRELALIKSERATLALNDFHTNPQARAAYQTPQEQAIRLRELQANDTLARIDYTRANASLPYKVMQQALKGDMLALKDQQATLNQTKTQIQNDAERKLEPLNLKAALIRSQLADNKAARSQIAADRSIPEHERRTKLLHLSREKQDLTVGLGHVDKEAAGVRENAKGIINGIQDQLNVVNKGLSTTRGQLADNKKNMPSPFMWDWKGAMFGGMYGSIVGGRTGSLVGAGVGGLFGLPAGIAASTAMIPMQMVGKFISTEFHLAEHAAGALIHVIERLGTTAIELAMDWEKVGVAFQVFTGSKETGRSMLEGIRALAVATPFRTGQLTGPAQTLLGYGIENQNVLPALSRLGDIAGGNPERLRRLTLAFGQVNAHGRFMGQELRQFSEAGVGAKDFASTMGVSTSDFRQLMHDGKVPVEVMIDTINRLTNAGGRFFQMNKEQLKTVSGSWNSFRETIEITLEKLGTGFLKGAEVAPNLQYLQHVFSSLNGSNLEQKGEWFGKKMAPLLDVGTALAMQGPDLLKPIGTAFGLSPTLTVEEHLVLVGAKLADFANFIEKANLGIALFAQYLTNFVYATARLGVAGATLGLSEAPQLFGGKSLIDYAGNAIFGEGMMETIKHPRSSNIHKGFSQAVGRNAGFNFIEDYFKSKTEREAGVKAIKVLPAATDLMMIGFGVGNRGGAVRTPNIGGVLGNKVEGLDNIIALNKDLQANDGMFKLPHLVQVQKRFDQLGEFGIFGNQGIEKLQKGFAPLLLQTDFQKFEGPGGDVFKQMGRMGEAKNAIPIGMATAGMGMGFMGHAFNHITKRAEAEQYLEMEKAYKDSIPKDWRANYATLGSVDAQDAVNQAQQDARDIQVDIKAVLDHANELHEKHLKEVERAAKELERMRREGVVKVKQRGI